MGNPVGIMHPILGCELLDGFAVAKEIGFDCIEINVGSDYKEHPLYDREARRKLASLTKETGVAVASVCLGAFWSVPPSSADEEVRREALRLLEETIDICAELGASTILAPLTENDATKAEPHNVQRDRWAEMLAAAGKRADEMGVNVGLEACTRAYSRTAEQGLELDERSGSKRIGVYYDPGNSVIAGLDPAEEIPLLGERLVGFHVKDPGGAYLGEGNVDFPAVIAAVKENGYSGALILETDRGEDAKASAARNLEFTRKHFNG